MDPTTAEIETEQHPDGYTATPKGLPPDTVIIGQGDTAQEAEADCRSAIAFHQETFGMLAALPPVTVVHEPGDIVVIEGIKFSGEFFRMFALPPDDQWFRLLKQSEDGPIKIERVHANYTYDGNVT